MPDAQRIKELRSAYEAKADFIKEGAAKGIKIDGQNVEISPTDYKALETAMGEAAQIKNLIAMEQFGTQAAEFVKELDAPVGSSTAVAAAAAAQAFGMGSKSLGEMFTSSEEFKNLKASGTYTMAKPFEVQEKDMASMGSGYGTKDIYTGAVPGTTTLGFGRRQQDPMVPRAQRVNRVRDLFPVAGTSANLIDFFRVTGFAENNGAGNAGTVAERDGSSFALKPKSNLNFESASAPVRTIAHWEAAHRNVLQDEPQLQATINNELLYGLALEEDDQILNGDGTGENLLGILNTPGVQVYTQAASPDQKSDALRRAATLAIIANYPATGYVLHPYDWEDIELQKSLAGGDGQYMLVTNFTNGLQTTIWRQPVVETSAMNQGTFLTGAFGLGAQLYDRQAANVRIAEQHADFFVRNAIAVLAEERIALAVKRPESFVVGTFL